MVKLHLHSFYRQWATFKQCRLCVEKWSSTAVFTFNNVWNSRLINNHCRQKHHAVTWHLKRQYQTCTNVFFALQTKWGMSVWFILDGLTYKLTKIHLLCTYTLFLVILHLKYLHCSYTVNFRPNPQNSNPNPNRTLNFIAVNMGIFQNDM